MSTAVKKKPKTAAARKEKDEEATAQEEARDEILSKLREAGSGNVNRDDMVVREGQRYVIPEKATLGEAAIFLEMLAEEMEQVTEFVRKFEARPWDGAYCAFKIMREVFGAVSHKGGEVMGFFGPFRVRPEMRTIQTGYNQSEQIPWGAFQLPGFDNCEITFGGTEDRQKGALFVVQVVGPKKYQSEIEGLFNMIEAACKEYSIYKGKAIDGQDNPEFIRIDIDPEKVVFSGDVQVQMEANVWSVIEDSELQREVGLPLKRSVLAHGPYGVGKTLFLGLTAQRAVENGWTFIRCRPGDNYIKVLQTAALYAPAVCAFEDVDNLAGADSSPVDVARLLDTFDGVTAKGKDIIALLTTNYPEKIHKGMVRPGRLDAVIEIGALDQKGIERLVKALVPEGMLSSDVNFTQVAKAMDGYVPAFIREATDRAIRYAISRSKQVNGTTISTEDLVHAAAGLRPQLALMEKARDHRNYEPPLDRVVRRTIAEVAEGMLDGSMLIRSAEQLDMTQADSSLAVHGR